MTLHRYHNEKFRQPGASGRVTQETKQKEKRWIAMYVRSAAMSTTRLWETLTMEYLPEQSLKTCQATGFALFAARPRKILKKRNDLNFT